MRRVAIAAATVGASLALAASAQAQTAATPGVTAPVTTGIGTTGAGVTAAPGQQLTTVPSVITTIRRAGMGPGGFLQLCDDPLDPRVIENECSAAGIAQ